MNMKKVFLKGGYFNGIMYGLVHEDRLPEEILLHYYTNPIAEMHGVSILGITEKGPDDITRVLAYRKDDEAPGDVVIYTLVEEVDPTKVVKDDDSGELRRIEI